MERNVSGMEFRKSDIRFSSEARVKVTSKINRHNIIATPPTKEPNNKEAITPNNINRQRNEEVTETTSH